MAALYGVEATAGDEPTLLGGERAGLFARAAFLAQNAHASSTSPTKRGKYVREVVLCEAVAPPPPNANVGLRLDAPSPVPSTLRDHLTAHVVNPVCAGCHTVLDPVGLGLEQFDGIGAWRATEAGRPVDAHGSLDQTPFVGASELGRIVKNHAELGPCLVRNLFRYTTGHLEGDGERAVLDALARNFSAHGRSVKSLVRVIVESASFRYTGEPR